MYGTFEFGKSSLEQALKRTISEKSYFNKRHGKWWALTVRVPVDKG